MDDPLRVVVVCGAGPTGGAASSSSGVINRAMANIEGQGSHGKSGGGRASAPTETLGRHADPAPSDWSPPSLGPACSPPPGPGDNVHGGDGAAGKKRGGGGMSSWGV